jgi:SpoVK/Ycf46/Vps4 family AAA+-type ATPase
LYNAGETDDTITSYEETLDLFTRSINNGETNSKQIRDEAEHNMNYCVERLTDLKVINEKDESDKNVEPIVNEPRKQNCKNDYDEIYMRVKSNIVFEKPKINFSDVCGMESEIEALKRAIKMPLDFPSLMANIKGYQGFLFYGVLQFFFY